MNVSEMKLFTIDELMGAYVLDQRTTPLVVMISKVSNMVAMRRDPSSTGLDRSHSKRRRAQREKPTLEEKERVEKKEEKNLCPSMLGQTRSKMSED